MNNWLIGNELDDSDVKIDESLQHCVCRIPANFQRFKDGEVGLVLRNGQLFPKLEQGTIIYIDVDTSHRIVTELSKFYTVRFYDVRQVNGIWELFSFPLN